MDIQSDKEYHRKAIALLICFFLAFFYVETILKPYLEKNREVPTPTSEAGTSSVAANSPTTQAAGSTSLVSATGSDTPLPVLQEAAATGAAVVPSEELLKSAGTISVSNSKVDAEISMLGARITSWRLKDYSETQKKDSIGLNLVEHSENAAYPLGVYFGEQSDAAVKYVLLNGSGETEYKDIKTETVLNFSGVLSDGRTIQKTLRFSPDSYFVDVEIVIPGEEAPIAIEWNRYMDESAHSFIDPYSTQDFAWFNGESVDRESIDDVEDSGQSLGPAQWLSLGDKYFMAALVSPDANAEASASNRGDIYQARMTGPAGTAKFRAFVGPKKHSVLKESGYSLERNINFGKFGVISVPLLRMLQFLHAIFQNWGLAIVTLTILVRLALYPLNSTAFKQMKKMQALKPDLDRIRKNDDKQESQVQMMALYKKHGVNPLGGCLPMVLQIPVFIGLYSALMLAVELRHAHFALWINDLSSPEKLHLFGLGIPVLVILFVASMIAQQMTMPTQMDPMQKKIMMVMPIGLGFMFAAFPSGLTLYMLTSNLISIGQQKGLHYADDKGKSALKITLSVSAVVFTIAFIVSRF